MTDCLLAGICFFIPSAPTPPDARGRRGFGGTFGAFGSISCEDRLILGAESTLFTRLQSVLSTATRKNAFSVHKSSLPLDFALEIKRAFLHRRTEVASVRLEGPPLLLLRKRFGRVQTEPAAVPEIEFRCLPGVFGNKNRQPVPDALPVLNHGHGYSAGSFLLQKLRDPRPEPDNLRSRTLAQPRLSLSDSFNRKNSTKKFRLI